MSFFYTISFLLLLFSLLLLLVLLVFVLLLLGLLRVLAVYAGGSALPIGSRSNPCSVHKVLALTVACNKRVREDVFLGIDS